MADREGNRGLWGGGKKNKKSRNYVNFYFLCYSTSMEACSDTNKNKKIYTGIDT